MEEKNVEGLISRIYIAERRNKINNCVTRIQKSKVRQQRKLREYRGKHERRKENKICSKLVTLLIAGATTVFVGYIVGTIIINNID